MTTNEHFRTAKKKATAYGLELHRASDGRHKYQFVSPDTGRLVKFGAVGYSDFLEHHDRERRANYRRRHAAILNRSGEPAYRHKYSPAWASYYILW